MPRPTICLVAVAAVGLSGCRQSGQDVATETPAEAQLPATGSSAYPPEFWNTWRDGKAEVAAYEVTVPNSRRKSFVVTVFALEKLSNSRRVRAEQYRGRDVFPAMKMNVIRESAPGSGQMLSVFAALEPVNGHAAGNTTKVSFSAWGWPGHLWRQLTLTGNRANLSWHSYIEGEADGQSIRAFRDQYGVPEDALPMCARRIAWPILRLGQTEWFDYIPSLTDRRIHSERTLPDLTLSLSRDRHTTVVPAGSFRTHTFKASLPDIKLTKTWDVEADPPHRIVRWQTGLGETGSLLGAGRTEAEITNVDEALSRVGVRR